MDEDGVLVSRHEDVKASSCGATSSPVTDKRERKSSREPKVPGSNTKTRGLKFGMDEDGVPVSRHEVVKASSSGATSRPVTDNKKRKLSEPKLEGSNMKTQGGNYKYLCECKHCGSTIPYNSKNSGIVALQYHLNYECEYKSRSRQKVINFETDESGCSSNLVAVTVSKEACIEACTRMVILNALPFRFVEGEGFQTFWAAAYPKSGPPSWKAIAMNACRLYLHEKELLKSMFSSKKQRVSLSVDYWTSIENTDYMVLTAHYIDDEWRLHKKILNFRVVPDHKGETIGKIIESCLLSWGIERVFTINVGNVSANDGGINYVKEKLKIWNAADGTILEGEFLQLQCFAHNINSIVNEGLKDMHDSIVSIRNAVRYVRSTDVRVQKFKTYIELEKIEAKDFVILDKSNSWNSTYLMLTCALKFRKAFERLQEEDGSFAAYFLEDKYCKGKTGPPSHNDWEKAQSCVNFLKTFYYATLVCITPLYVTSNLYFHEMCSIQHKLTKLNKTEDPLIGTMVTGMKEKYNQNHSSIDSINRLLIISVVLDPRYKLDNVAFCFRMMYGDDGVEQMTKCIKDLLFCLYDFYSALGPSTGMEASNDDQLSSEDNVTEMSFKGYKTRMWDDDDDHYEFRKYLEKKYKSVIKHEVDKYLSEATTYLCDDDKFDTLNWWKLNATRYPVLSCVAKDVFAIPVHTVTSEFCIERPTLDPFRSSLSPKIAEALICAQDWLQSSVVSADNKSCTEEKEFLEFLESEFLGSTSTADCTVTD